MIIHAYAKLNWFLSIEGQRSNGYHDLLMINQRLSLSDTLHLETRSTLSLRVDGDAGIDEQDNLVFRAANALAQATDFREGASMRLEKRIPVGAGLGGGSADAAAALIGLNELWQLGLTIERLADIGLPLGADIPYCLYREPAIVQGVGERITPLSGITSCWILLLKPAEGLRTGEVFRQAHEYLQPAGDSAKAVEALRLGQFEDLRRYAVNHLQQPALSLLPEVGSLINSLYEEGALFAQMSGAGSCVYGVFASELAADTAYHALRHQAHFAEVCRTIS